MALIRTLWLSEGSVCVQKQQHQQHWKAGKIVALKYSSALEKSCELHTRELCTCSVLRIMISCFQLVVKIQQKIWAKLFVWFLTFLKSKLLSLLVALHNSWPHKSRIDRSPHCRLVMVWFIDWSAISQSLEIASDSKFRIPANVDLWSLFWHNMPWTVFLCHAYFDNEVASSLEQVSSVERYFGPLFLGLDIEL